MAIKEVTLAANGGEPAITVFIGQAQFGAYHLYLKNPATNQRVEQQNGDNADDVDDTFPLKVPLGQLNGQILSWWIIVAALGAGPGQLYFARLGITQGGSPVAGGGFEYHGPLDNTQNIIDFVRIKVQ